MGPDAVTSDWLFFAVIAAARFLLPLAIPRFPLLAIVASLALDAVDQSLFQQFTSLTLDAYQGYDKALDIYYLTIAYISTMRNWPHRFAFRVSRFLFHWRLAGVALFELTHLRPLLLIFPNAFEYFFVFYEAYTLRWDPRRMTKRLVLIAAAAIWIAIKLPQEYLLHIAKIDTTDWLKTVLFRMPIEASWSETLQARPLNWLGLLAVAALVYVGLRRLAAGRLPPADRAVAFSADAHSPAVAEQEARSAVAREAHSIVDVALTEKIVLVTLVCISFAQVLPDAMQTTNLQFAFTVTAAVTINTALSHWLARRGFGWAFSLWQFIVMGAVNSGVILAYAALRAMVQNPLNLGNAFFFALLLTLLITLFDHYRQAYLMRFGPAGVSSPFPGSKA